MKKSLVSIAKFIGLHLLVGIFYNFFLYLSDSLPFISYIYETLSPILKTKVDVFNIFILDSLITLFIFSKYVFLKGKYSIIKKTVSWIAGITIAYYTSYYMLMLYWVI
ncbi:MAG: hypothetical protein UH854_02455 [Clostridia bacterium]|nr:hypothetical protein [Clostridia bacterium]